MARGVEGNGYINPVNGFSLFEESDDLIDVSIVYLSYFFEVLKKLLRVGHHIIGGVQRYFLGIIGQGYQVKS